MITRRVTLSAVLLTILLLLPSSRSLRGESNKLAAEAVQIRPDGRGNVTKEASADTSSADPITYHLGPIMLGSTHLYYIWYGNWSPGDATVKILEDFARSLGGSPYFSINTTYTELFGASVSNALSFNGSLYDHYSRGFRLSEADVLNVVMAKQPFDPYGIYMVLTSGDVDQTTSTGSFGQSFCGWHDHSFQFLFFRDIKFGFVGSPDRFDSCIAQSPESPNGSITADSMASAIAHEIGETVTDPDLNAWFDANGNENGDKCAWNFGASYGLPNGSRANVHLGSRDFYIQQNWINSSSGGCALNLGTPATGDTMHPADALYPGGSIQSRNGEYTLTLQTDGNLVLYRTGAKALWATHTEGQPTAVCVMQADGNLVLYKGGLVANWASHTSKNQGSHLVVQDDGNVVIYRANGSVVWATNTVQR